MKKSIFKRVIAGVATFSLALSAIVAIGKTANINAAETLDSTYSDAWTKYVDSDMLSDADLSGVDSIKLFICAVDLNYGWNSMMVYTNGDAWVQKSLGGSETSSEVILETVGEFTETVALTPNADGWFEIGFGYSSSNAFVIEGIEFYAGDTYLGTYADGSFTQNKVETTVIGDTYSSDWTAYVNNSSEVFKNFDLSKADSVKIDAIAYDLNWGWNSMQVYTNGDAWVQKSLGGSETSSEVILETVGEFTETVALTPNADGWFEIGFGYTSSNAFVLLSMDFYQGTELLGSLVGDTFYPNATLELAAGSAALKTGAVYTITTTAGSTAPVGFSSDNTAVATVDEDGVVSALATGVANITVTDAFGNAALFTVTVTDKEVVNFKEDKTTLTLPDATYTVEVVGDAEPVAPTWKSSDESVATVDENGVITAVAEGTAVISVESVDGIETTFTVTVVSPQVETVTDVSVEVSEEAPATTITTSKEEVIEAATAGLTEEAQEAVEAATEVDVVLSVDVIDENSVAEAEKAIVDKFLEENTDSKIAVYLDLGLSVIADGARFAVNTAANAIEIAVDIPADLPEVAEDAVRTYKVLRIHDGEQTELPTEVKDGKIVFSTDKFSTYVLTYADVAAASDPGLGDVATAAPWVIAGVSAIVLAGAVFGLKRKEQEA